jgi:hypothetical protein
LNAEQKQWRLTFLDVFMHTSETTSSAIEPIDINWPFGAPSPTLHCPRTGKLVAKPGDYVEQPASPYVAFVYINEVDEFDYIRPDLEAKMDAASLALEEDDDTTTLELLMSVMDPRQVPLVFAVHTGGMACGPSWTTVTYGFELWSADVEGKLG